MKRNLLDLAPAEFAGLKFQCSCGKEHSVEIRKILIESGCLKKLPQVIKELGGTRVFLIADENTFSVAGREARELLEQAGIPLHGKVFPGSPTLVPNEFVLGAVLAAMEPEDDFILAVGSGCLNDTAKLLSARTGVPYMIAATAPSMDGYASTVSPMILDGKKITKPAVYPMAILADTAILKDAPMTMLTAGLGDIIGKYTALADWRLSRDINGEYYCEEAVSLMERAVEKCAESAALLKSRDEEAVRYVTEALILSGVAMGLVGNSRPASGAEHHFAHYWEVDFLSRGEEHALHGNSVGAAAVVSASLYELAASELPQGFAPPDKQRILSALQAAGACISPKELGISRALFCESVLHAMEIRERFTILRFLAKKQLLSACATELTNRFYQG